MKIHITNQYGFISEKNISERQKKYSKAGQELGFYEMGIFIYDSSSENDNELSSRLDGIIAAVENDDVVIVQLPTGNGADFEKKLFDKIASYSGRKPLLLWHDMNYYTRLHDQYSVYASGEEIADLRMNVMDLYHKKVILDFLAENVNMEDNNETTYKTKAIHICFGLHDKNGDYSVWVGTTMQSVIERTDAYLVFHILHDDTLTDSNRNKLRKVAEESGNKVVFHKFDALIFDETGMEMGRFTVGTMFRVMLPEILPDLDKIIYLDADLLVNRDIEELWNINIDNYCLAAVPDSPTINGIGVPYAVAKNQVKKEEYFNAGVLCLNLRNIRMNCNLHKAVIDYLKENPDSWLPDQDALNAIFAGKTLLLEGGWNYFSTDAARLGEIEAEEKIYHFAADILCPYREKEIDKLYYQTILRTPWRETGEKILERGLKLLNDIITQQEK